MMWKGWIALVLTLVMSSAEAQAATPGGVWRWLGVGWGPGYHATSPGPSFHGYTCGPNVATAPTGFYPPGCLPVPHTTQRQAFHGQTAPGRYPVPATRPHDHNY